MHKFTAKQIKGMRLTADKIDDGRIYVIATAIQCSARTWKLCPERSYMGTCFTRGALSRFAAKDLRIEHGAICGVFPLALFE